MRKFFILLPFILLATGGYAQRFSAPYVEIKHGVILFHAPIDATPNQRLVPDCISNSTRVRADIMLPPHFEAQAFRDQQEARLHHYAQKLDTRQGQEDFITTYLLLIHINRGKTAEYQKAYAHALKKLRNSKGTWVKKAMELVKEAEERDQYH
ncbi:MAG: hypothetical protein CSA95_04545 [Bacteroidetes bacterium]|nr:MAG: hypothetical protein CSA95_04545 [Bacteroidota bacterium]